MKQKHIKENKKTNALYFSLQGGFIGKVVGPALQLGEKEQLLFNAYVPGISFPVAASKVTRAITCNKTSLLDLYHVVYNIARKEYLAHNLFPMHAACITRNKKHILVVGHSGSGKTAVVLAALQYKDTALFSGNKTVLSFTKKRTLQAHAGTKTITAQAGDLANAAGVQYGSRTAFSLPAKKYSENGEVAAIVLLRLNDGFNSYEKLSAQSALHTLFPYCLDVVNADVIVEGHIYDGTVSSKKKEFLLRSLQRVLKTTPVFSVTGSKEFVVKKIRGLSV